MRIAVDVGGTFTDVVILNEITAVLRVEKVPTTPEDPATGVLQSFEKVGAPLPQIDYFIQETTLGLNPLLTRTSSRVALLTTKGFRNVYLLGRTASGSLINQVWRENVQRGDRTNTRPR